MKEQKVEKKVKVKKKLSSKAKKIIVLSCFCVLLLVTGGVNILINSTANSQQGVEANVQTTASFFTNYRTNRESTYNQQIAYLQVLLTTDGVSAESKEKAEAEILSLQTNLATAKNIENVLLSKGFSDAVVSISSGRITVMVETSSRLERAQMAQIEDAVVSNSDFNLDALKVIEV